MGALMDNSVPDISGVKLCVVGLGYVGFPLAVEFAKYFQVVGFDIDAARVQELLRGFDRTMELDASDIVANSKLKLTTHSQEIEDCNVFIVTVPTPVTEEFIPDLQPLKDASKIIAGVLSKGDCVIYESTVYPGVTEEECIPVLEMESGLTINKDFVVGYSPERINPGDKTRSVCDVVKVTSGSSPAASEFVDSLYSKIIRAGTHKASSIRVAEASKVIENIQRDVNIALMNELSQIFDRLQISTREVLTAAGTKWNFAKFSPGLVGGHCISVDPYYLLHKASVAGYIPNLIRKSREINEAMVSYVAQRFLRELVCRGVNPVGREVVLLGFSFKEDCPDTRNTKVLGLFRELESMGFSVKIYDPVVDSREVLAHYNLEIETTMPKGEDCLAILCVPHAAIISELGDADFEYVYDFRGVSVEPVN